MGFNFCFVIIVVISFYMFLVCFLGLTFVVVVVRLVVIIVYDDVGGVYGYGVVRTDFFRV